ncbi:PRC-barrel domain containing protein [Roseomonas terrae]|uniref:PRC-barrel domain containing protein n=1 Tax=Neoroseomonas terrae TaxID=424799 RepID=A0ABS5EQ98_9PROT|nr:PRC-barrel domain-containing protein [Neoroseomonas terrae]MBR0652782.1 PRC-barrel domain containing protein [Neoroseomonas terrae]
MTHSSIRRALLTAAIVSLPGLALAQAPSTTTPAAPSVAAPPSTTVTTPTPAATARRASQIIGANIINEENRNVGEVHDLMVDAAGGATIAVLSVGGFLGMGERYIAIPLSDLRWNGERERWMLPGATVDSLKARPAFTYPERR